MNFPLFYPEARYRLPVRSVLVLSPGRLPTTDIYLAPRFSALHGMEVVYRDTVRTKPEEFNIASGTLVIIVRHVSRAWLRYLSNRQSDLAGVVYLMDDDIPGILGCPALPLRYAVKTAARYLAIRPLLGALCHDIWVATPYLQQKYRSAPTRVVPPLYVGPLAETPGREPLYFYSGTASHRREMAWLVPVIKAVQSRAPGARFDIFGKSRLARLFSGIPGVRVLPPMPWPEFLQYSCRRRYAVGLAPLFDTPFNLARSHNKFFDITRCGAAGIYSDMGAFRDWVMDDKTGLLRSNDVDDWVAAICDLLTHPEKRLRLYRGALAQCREVSSRGEWGVQYVSSQGSMQIDSHGF